MKTSNALRLMGQPIAYYKGLAKPLGGVTAAILFSQLFYWNDKTDNPLGVYKQLQELCEETGLTLEELNTARKKLKAIGVLLETHKRLEHRLYFKLDLAKFDELMEMFGEQVDADFPNQEKAGSRNGESPVREQVNTDFVIHKITTKNTTLDYNNNTPLPPNSPDGDLGKSAVADEKATGDFAKNQSEPTACKKTKQPPVDYVGIAQAYNESVMAADKPLPKVADPENLSDKRKRAIHKLAKQFQKRFGSYAPAAFRDYFDDFLRSAPAWYFGQNERGWKADFEYLLREATLDKTIEGGL